MTVLKMHVPLLLPLQMVVACRVLAEEPGDDKAVVTNIVFMGMGGEDSPDTCRPGELGCKHNS